MLIFISRCQKTWFTQKLEVCDLEGQKARREKRMRARSVHPVCVVPVTELAMYSSFIYSTNIYCTTASHQTLGSESNMKSPFPYGLS